MKTAIQTSHVYTWFFSCVSWYTFKNLKLHHLIVGSVVLCGDCHCLCLGSTGVNNSPLGSWSPYQTKRPSEGYLVAVRSVTDVKSYEPRLLRHCRSHHELKASYHMHVAATVAISDNMHCNFRFHTKFLGLPQVTSMSGQVQYGMKGSQ